MSAPAVTPHLAAELAAPVARDGAAARPAAPAKRRIAGLSGLPPWTPADQLGLLVSTGMAAAGLACCWAFAAGNISWGERLQWLTGAVVALIVGGVGDGLWLLRGHRAVRRRKQVLFGLLEASAAAARGRDPGAETVGAARYAGPRMTRYHHADCLLVAGKPVTAATLDEHAREGRAPCAMCGA